MIKFIPNALKKGAAYIITSKNVKKYKDKIIKVENEIKFLNILHRKNDKTLMLK